MKLYYSPGACSQSPHIVLCELGLPHELEQVDFRTHTTASGKDYRDVNPNGYVPALELEDGQVLTEGAAIVQYLAEQKPEAGLLPPAGSVDRARVFQWLTFTSSELHKSFSVLFNPASAEEWKAQARKMLEKRLAYVERALSSHEYLVGDRFTVADAYLFVVLGWAEMMQIDTGPAVQAYRQRISARPAVQQALQAEGILTNP